MEHAHHAVNDIDKADVDDTLWLAAKALEHASDEMDLFDCFCVVSVSFV